MNNKNVIKQQPLDNLQQVIRFPAPAKFHTQLVMPVHLFDFLQKVVTRSPVLLQIVDDNLRQQNARRFRHFLLLVRVLGQLDLRLDDFAFFFLFGEITRI